MNEDALQRLYQGVSSKFDVGSYNDFKGKMATPDDRKKFYDAASSKVDIGPYGEYESKIAGQPSEPAKQSWADQPIASVNDAPANGVNVGATQSSVPQSNYANPTPLIPAKKPETPYKTSADVKSETDQASKTLANDVVENSQNIQEYKDNLNAIPFTQQGNIVHDITNPHGDPEVTGKYALARIAQLEEQRKKDIATTTGHYQQDVPEDSPDATEINKKYDQKIAEIKSAANHVIELQLANNEITSPDKKFNSLEIGIKKQALLGDKQAQNDLVAINNGKKISPDAKVHYQAIGLGVLQNGKANASASGQEAVAQQFGQHSDDAQNILEKENPEYFKNERIQQIANYLYQNENAVHGTLFSRESVSDDELKQAAKALGFTAAQIKGIKPEDIPRSAGLLNQATQGLLNTAGAPLYEGGMRALAALGVADKDEVNKRFQPGWENQGGAGTMFVGQTPQAQSELTVSNPRGVLGVMAKGIGDLGGFLAGGEAGGAILEGAGIVSDVEKANKIANFATAALPSYNSAYDNSLKIIGDNPKDEGKRQLYAIINGTIGGAAMMIDPQANIGRDIIGETAAGKNFINTLKKDGIEGLTKSDLRDKVTQMLTETLKHEGLQTAIPVINTMGENITNMVFDPTGHHDLTDNTGHAAISGAIGMLIPSIAAGLNHPRNQTALNKGLMYEVGRNPDEYKKEVANNLSSGNMTPEDAKIANDAIDKLQHIVNNQVPGANLDGKKLNEQQKQDYAWSLLKSNDLEGKLQAAENTKDEAQIKSVKSAASQLVKEREDILNTAGDIKPALKPLAPKEESIDGADTEEVHTQDYHDLSKFAEENGFHVTSTTGGEHNAGSKHGKGLAIDVRTRDKSPEEIEALLAKAKDEGYIVHDERTHPKGQKVWSGSHLHIELPSGEKIIVKNKENKKTSIPLSSDKENESHVTTKSTDNEETNERLLVQNEEGRRGNPDDEEGTKEPNLRRTANGEQELGKEPGQQEDGQVNKESLKDQEIQQESLKASAESVLPRKRRKLIFHEEEEPISEQKNNIKDVPNPIRKEEFAAWDQGKIEGEPKATHEQEIKNAEPDEKIGGGESFNEFKDRIHSAWDNLQETGKDKTLLVAHSGVMKMIEAADEHGWDNTEALKRAYNAESEPRVGEIIHHEGKNGEILITRHGQSEDNADNLLRTKDAPLTDKGKEQAVTHIADKLKEEGVTPSEIISSHLPRASETADIVHGEFTNSKNKENASTSSKKQQQEGAKQGGESEHARTEQAGLETTSAEAENSHSDVGGQKEEKVKAKTSTKQPESFETSQGSIYKYLPDGRTQRYKTAEGKGYDPQDLTSFVKFKDLEQEQRFLSGVQEGYRNGTKVYLIDKNGKIYNRNEEAAGKDVKLALVNYKTGEVIETAKTTLTPEKGYKVFDQRRYKEGSQEFREKHLGNEITKINYKDDAPSEADNNSNKKELSASDKRTKEIDLELQRQRASQKLESALRDKAEKEKNIDKANKHNENWYKKKDRIERLEEEKAELEYKSGKEEREANIKQAYNDFADRLQKKYDANKKAHEGLALSGILGISHKIGDHVADFIVSNVIEQVRELGNLHIAIDRVIRMAKEKFGEEAKYLSKEDNEPIHSHLSDRGIKNANINHEPVLSIDHEEYAKDILADILSGKITHLEAIQEVRNEERENREGNPVSEHVAENQRSKILRYIDWHIHNDLSSIKNDFTRARREQLGLNQEAPTAKKEFGETWDEAKEKIEGNPRIPEILIKELSNKVRPLTDVENAILLHHQISKEIELQKNNDKINRAAENGDKAALIEAKLSKAATLDELQQIYDINKAVGTENARGLASRRMLADRKYSLVNMIAEKRAAANDGKALSEQQQQDIEQLHEKIRQKQQDFDDYVKKSESQIIDLQRKALSGTLKDKKTASAKLREFADKIEQSSKNQAYSSPIPITPKMVAEAIRLVAHGVEAGEKLVDLVKKAIENVSKNNPGIDESHLEREVNKNLIDSGILEPSPERREAKDMSGLFINGKINQEAVRLKATADRAKSEFDHQLKKDNENSIPIGNKALNFLIKLEREYKLSSPLTMAKLMAAGLTKLALHPMEEVIGGGYSKIFPKLAKGAIGEGGGLNATAYAKSIANSFKMWGEDAKQIMQTGKTDLDVSFGKDQPLPPEAINFFGHLHSAEKAPIKRTIMEYQLQKRMQNMIANGVDVTDPIVMTSIGIDAYKDGQRAIFMNDNAVADFYNKKVKEMEAIDPKTGKPKSQSTYALSKAMQFLIPFSKIPSNIVATSARKVYGLPVGLTQAIYHAFKGDIEHLPVEEKDMIMRNLKQGTLGAAGLLYGFYLYNKFGGFYQSGQDWKKKKEDPDWSGAEIGGVKIPQTYMEAPIFQAMQVGATFRKVLNHKLKGEEEGVFPAIWASAAGLSEENPLLSQPMRLSQLWGNPYEQKQYIGELAKSSLVPSGVSYLAKVTDDADDGSLLRKIFAPENKRKTPKTITDHIKSGIPVLREDLQEK